MQWQNCRVKRDRTIGHGAAPAPARFGVLALALVFTVACSAPASSGAQRVTGYCSVAIIAPFSVHSQPYQGTSPKRRCRSSGRLELIWL